VGAGLTRPCEDRDTIFPACRDLDAAARARDAPVPGMDLQRFPAANRIDTAIITGGRAADTMG
jgi:hypothetical protein